MDFNNTLPEWENTGAEPSATLKNEGFKGGYKPPDSVFNWFWSKVIAAITELQSKLSTVDSTKADIYTFSGGFIGGDSASTESGGAIGQNTNSTSGFAGGRSASAMTGGSIGNNSKETNGGFAGGEGATASYGGAVGKRAKSANGGGAAGLDAQANYGGAVGWEANAGKGFSGGYKAKVATPNATAIDAIQLGEGTNVNEKTLQVYSYTLMNEDGTINKNRLLNASGGFDGGEGASATQGAAIGKGSFTGVGGAVGFEAEATSGGAVGWNAFSTGGGAVGEGAYTSIGFAGGQNAKTVNDGMPIDAIQLGTGTNYTAGTLQVYDTCLLEADGKIPNNVLKFTISDGQTTIFSSGYQTEIDYVFSSGTYKADVVISNSNKSDSSEQVPVNTVCILGANKIIFTKPQGVTSQTSIDITYKVIEYKN